MKMFQGYPIVDSSTIVTNGNNHGTGYELRDYKAYPKAKAFSRKIIDPSEYEDRIREKDKARSWITDICDFKGVKVKNQSRSNYCWIHAPVHGMEVHYALSGSLLKPLSAFYAGAIIKGGANRGGSGIVGVEFLVENGTCLEEMHPPMDFSTRNRQDVIDNAKLHKITSYEEADPDDHKAIITSILSNEAVTVGIPAWTHEVLITKLVFDKAAFPWNFGVGYIIDNSWDVSWGNNGRGILSRMYSRFDEAGIITSVSPSTR